MLARHQVDKPNGPQRQWEQKLGFYNFRERRWWFVESYNLVNAAMVRPHVIWMLPDGTRREILAEGGVRIDGVWTFTNVHVLVYSATAGAVPEQREWESLPMPVFSETPEEIRSEIKINKLTSFKAVKKTQLSINEIMEYKRLHPGGTNKDKMLDTKLHGRLAAPWTCLVVVL